MNLGYLLTHTSKNILCLWLCFIAVLMSCYLFWFWTVKWWNLSLEVFATNFCWRFPRKPLHNNTVCDIHIYDNRGMISQYLALKAVIRGHPIQKLSEILVNPYSPLGIKSPSWLANTRRLPLAGSSPAPRRRGLMAFSSFSSTSSTLFFFFCFFLGLSAQLTQVPSWQSFPAQFSIQLI